MRIAKKALLLAVQRGVTAVDVFSTTLYTGNGSTQTITNGIDLAGEGGLVWIKARSSAYDHFLTDTLRGKGLFLKTNSTDQELDDSSNWVTGSFNSDGFTVPGVSSTYYNRNDGTTYASWTFRQAPKFFDIVQYTGDGTSGRQIAHDLGVAPGMIVVKRLDASNSWLTYHRTLGATQFVKLETTEAAAPSTNTWNDTEPTDSIFTLGTANNASGGSYIAYLFAHDQSDSGIIQCGSFSTDANGEASVSLGWSPQWVLIKRTDSSGNWYLLDTERGWGSSSDPFFFANSAGEETAGFDFGSPNPDGFEILNSIGASANFIYMSIRAPE